MSEKPTIRSLARELDVSTATVSKALRGLGRLSENTRERVVALARERGYVADPLVAAGLSRVRRDVVYQENVVCLWDADPALYSWTEGLRASRDQRAADLGYKLEDHVVDFDSPRKLAGEFRMLRSRGVRGLIFAHLLRLRHGVDLDLDHFAWVAIGNSVPEAGIHRVVRNLRRDIPRCVRALEEKGFRRIGFVESDQRARQSKDALLAYSLAWHHRQGWPLKNPYHELASGETAAFRTWLATTHPDALVLGQSVGAEFRECIPKTLPKVNLTVPQGPHPEPGCLPHYNRMGVAAIDLLRNMLTHNEVGLPDHAESVAIESRWIEAGQRMEEGE